MKKVNYLIQNKILKLKIKENQLDMVLEFNYMVLTQKISYANMKGKYYYYNWLAVIEISKLTKY